MHIDPDDRPDPNSAAGSWLLALDRRIKNMEARMCALDGHDSDDDPRDLELKALRSRVKVLEQMSKLWERLAERLRKRLRAARKLPSLQEAYLRSSGVFEADGYPGRPLRVRGADIGAEGPVAKGPTKPSADQADYLSREFEPEPRPVPATGPDISSRPLAATTVVPTDLLIRWLSVVDDYEDQTGDGLPREMRSVAEDTRNLLLPDARRGP